MAEPLSIAASAIGIAAFAQQLADSTLKVKRFCRDVKDAPSELQETVEQIEHMSRILTQLAQDQPSEADVGTNGDILQESLQYCRKAVDRISTLATDLQNRMERHRRRTAIKIVPKQDEMLKLQTKLDRSKFDLMFAKSMYEDARRKKEHEHIRKFMEEEREGRIQLIEYTRAIAVQPTAPEGSLLTTANENCQELAEENCTSRHLVRNRKNAYRSRVFVKEIQLRLPFWLCQYAWDIAFERAAGRWTASLKSYRILPFSHEAYRMCWRGRIDDIRGLLNDGKLSLHDQFEDGWGLLGTAIISGEVELSTYLLECGLETTERFDDMLRERVSIGNAFGRSRNSLEYAQRHAKLILDECGGEQSPIVRAICKSPSAWTDEEKIDVLSYTRRTNGMPLISDIPDAIENLIPKPDQVCDVRQTQLFHVIACHWAPRLSDNFRTGLPPTESQHALQRSIELGGDIHAMDEQGCTPFMLLLLGRMHWGAHDGFIRSWAAALAKAGVDLERYGVVERAYWAKFLGEQESYFLRERGLIGFAHGKSPSDWRLWIRHEGDLFAGLFWDMLDHPERRLPGAWIEMGCGEGCSQCYRMNEKWRVGGMKRKALRRMRRGWDHKYSTVVVAELEGAVHICADLWKSRASDRERREHLERLHGLRRSLGISRAHDSFWLYDEDWFG